MSSTISICAEGWLVLYVFLDPQFIFWFLLCSSNHTVSPLWFRHSSRLIQIRSLAVLWRRSPSWTCWREAGIGTRIS